jgi:hypothetical protein
MSGVGFFVSALALLDQFLDPIQARVAAVATHVRMRMVGLEWFGARLTQLRVEAQDVVGERSTPRFGEQLAIS